MPTKIKLYPYQQELLDRLDKMDLSGIEIRIDHARRTSDKSHFHEMFNVAMKNGGLVITLDSLPTPQPEHSVMRGDIPDMVIIDEIGNIGPKIYGTVTGRLSAAYPRQSALYSRGYAKTQMQTDYLKHYLPDPVEPTEYKIRLTSQFKDQPIPLSHVGKDMSVAKAMTPKMKSKRKLAKLNRKRNRK